MLTCKMAQCQADHKKHSTSRFDLYGGIFSGQLYGTSAGNGHMDRLHTPSYNVSRVIGGNCAQENMSNGNFRDGSYKAGIVKAESANGNAYGGINSMETSHPTGGDRRKSTGGIGVESEATTPLSGNGKGGFQSGANRNLPTPKETSPSSGTPPVHSRKSSGEISSDRTTPPVHSRRSSGEISSDRNSAKGIPQEGFAYGDIIKGIGNLCDDLSHRGLKSGDLDSGSSKGRSSRAESPKSIGSSSSGGSSSADSPTVGRIVNFGNILPSGGSMKNGSSPVSTSGASVSGRGGNNSSNGLNGHAPVPIPTTGAIKGSRRSNSWDYASGTLKPAHARTGSETGTGGAYAGANVGVNLKGSLSTSPSASASSGYGASHAPSESAKPGVKSFGNIALEAENLLLKNALSSADAEDLKNSGNEQYKRGHFGEALSLYDKAVSLSPDKAPYRSNKAAALTGLGRFPEAVQECLNAIRLDPCYTRAHHRLASLYLRLGQVDHANKHFKLAGQVEWSDTQRIMTIQKHILKCNSARKASDWRALLRETDGAIIAGADSSPLIMAYKGEALLNLHQPEEADAAMANIRRFEDLLKRPSWTPTNTIVIVVQGKVDMALGRFDAAVVAFEKACYCAPHDTTIAAQSKKARAVAVARKLGNDLFNVGRFAEASSKYGEGLESAPGNAVLLCNRAACRSKLNQWEKAVEDCNAALVAQPNYTKALLRRAASNYKLERFEDSLRDYEVLRRELPGDAEVARNHFDVQNALKRSKGENSFKMRFGGEVEEVTTNDQFQEAITAPGLAVVQFCTRWSERCKKISPFVDDLCKQYLSINFVKVDVDDLPYLAKLENVSFVPTFKIYKNGSKKKEISGPTPQALESLINQFST